MVKLMKKYYGLNKIDKKLVRYMNYKNGFFIDVGANDGETQSNTLHLEKYYSWSGLLIEPIKEKFIDCINNRSQKNLFINTGVVGPEYTHKSMRFMYSNLMTTALNLDSSSIENPYEHARKGKKYLKPNEDNYEFEIGAMTLEQIFEKFTIPNFIDLLSIDIEGGELSALKGINFTKRYIKWILIEARDIKTIEEFLEKRFYETKDQLSHHDYLFEKRI